MYPERKLFAIGWVKHKCKPGANGPKFRLNYVTGKNVAKVNARKPENTRLLLISPAPKLKTQQEKSTPVTAAIRREYKQTWKTLDEELAYALWPGDIDAGNIDGSIHRWAKNEVIDKDREDWKRISASMRKQPDAVRYNRQTIFGLVRERPIDIHKDPWH
ncbi:hypothetical protein ECZC10_54690 [Escherichia coli]|nr:hypothetical protein ECZC10_54690 [Escherichia coli]